MLNKTVIWQKQENPERGVALWIIKKLILSAYTHNNKAEGKRYDCCLFVSFFYCSINFLHLVVFLMSLFSSPFRFQFFSLRWAVNVGTYCKKLATHLLLLNLLPVHSQSQWNMEDRCKHLQFCLMHRVRWVMIANATCPWDSVLYAVYSLLNNRSPGPSSL